jgi:phytanoyl-CoA hydroxylase
MMAHPAIVQALTQLIGPDLKAMQSMLFIKSKGKPGQAWHQDELFIPHQGPVADGRVDRPGRRHRGQRLPVGPPRLPPARGSVPGPRPRRPRFDCEVEAYDFPYQDDDAVAVEVPAGSVVLFNGYLLHMSLPNTGRNGLRRALVNHYMSVQSLLPWMLRPPGSAWGEPTTATSWWSPGPTRMPTRARPT